MNPIYVALKSLLERNKYGWGRFLVVFACGGNPWMEAKYDRHVPTKFVQLFLWTGNMCLDTTSFL